MTELEGLRTAAEYQFGSGAGAALFADPDDLEISRSGSGRVRQVHDSRGRVVTYGTDGRFRLGVAGGHRLGAALAPPACRVRVGEESVPHVRRGRNAFAKFVRRADARIRPRDEVLVVGPEGELLGVGRAELPGPSMADLDRGVAVEIRGGSGQA